jgi:lipoprotein LprG
MPPTARAIHPARPARAALLGAALLGAAVSAALLVAGCTGSRDVQADLTGLSGPELLAVVADEMAELETVRLAATVEAELAGLPVRQVEAQVTRDGDAAGTAQIEQFSQLFEMEFVVVGEDFHYRLVGDWQRLTRAEVGLLYLDLAAVLDPDRGLANLLRTATTAELVATPETSPEQMYEVTAAFDPDSVSELLPGVPDGLTGTLWIDADRPVVRRVRFDLPGLAPITVELSDFDAPADIRVP